MEGGRGGGWQNFDKYPLLCRFDTVALGAAYKEPQSEEDDAKSIDCDSGFGEFWWILMMDFDDRFDRFWWILMMDFDRFLWIFMDFYGFLWKHGDDDESDNDDDDGCNIY